ncbi:hypothetical protein BGZ81_001859 [Podila clonocystis]|nr:hypothetical protein BGZ81_001859 [Podila clonocystis]
MRPRSYYAYNATDDQNEGSEALAEALETLKTNSTLTTLNMGGNSIRDNGGLALAEALKVNSTLTNLDLWPTLHYRVATIATSLSLIACTNVEI